jgi:hypothetical protein
MTTRELGTSEDPQHRATFPDRRCVVANSECRGNVDVRVFSEQKSAMLCAGHNLAFQDADWAGRVDRLREWVRTERAKGKTP